MAFQSKDPIINITFENDLKDKKSKEAVGHSHGIVVKHPTTYGETLIHFLKGNIGSGLFAMGNGIKNSGIILGPLVVVILGLICTVCQHLLLSVASNLNEKNKLAISPSYAETAKLCFEYGPPKLQGMARAAKITVIVFLCVTQLGFCCVYFVFISENIKQLLDYYGYVMDVHIHMIIILIPILLPSLITNLKYLVPFSSLANVLMAIGIVIVMYYALETGNDFSDRVYVADPQKWPLFFGTAIFAFEGIGLILPLKNEMKNPSQFTKPLGVLNVGMVIVTATYAIVGCVGYLKYGEEVKGSLSLNLPPDEILAQSVKAIISGGILFTYTLQFYIPAEIIWDGILESFGPFRHPIMLQMCCRTCLVLLTFVLAEAIPFLGLFISLIGAVSGTGLTMVFPPILDIVSSVSCGKLTKLVVIRDGTVLLIGLVGMLTGGYQSLYEIALAIGKKQ